MRSSGKTKKRGFSLLEALIVGSLMSVLGIVILQSSLMSRKSLYISQNHVAASNMINQQVETIRGMDYENIGIRNSDNAVYINSYVVSNDTYKASEDYLMSGQVVLGDGGSTRRDDDIVGKMVVTGVAIDDPFDGIGANDADAVTNDYYQVQVLLTWDFMGKSITRNAETFVYGLMQEGGELDLEGDRAGDDTPVGEEPTHGDVGVLEITKAEYQHKKKAKDNKLKVEARYTRAGSHTLTLKHYGQMKYKGKDDKYKYDKKEPSDPGNSVTVTAEDGATATRSIKHKYK